jgi:hypothetical protein
MPHPLRSLAQSQLPCAPYVFPHPPRSLPACRAFIFTYKDDINKFDSSVGHNSDILVFRCQFISKVCKLNVHCKYAQNLVEEYMVKLQQYVVKLVVQLLNDMSHNQCMT